METLLQVKRKSGNVKTRTPKLGFLGIGWIGQNRLEAILAGSDASIVALCDPYSDKTARYSRENGLRSISTYEELLNEDIDGIIIATPSAMHKDHALLALEQGKAVFCQKPLACSYEDTRLVISEAERMNCLLGVDMSYRYTNAMKKIHHAIESGELGDVYAAQLTFHNAYGPDKSWYYNRETSGGGCLMDLGVHLVDLLYWLIPGLETPYVVSNLYAQGKPYKAKNDVVEDFAEAQLTFNTGLSAQLACSWNISAGKEAILEFTFFGTKGGATFRNMNGSFYDFKAELYKGTKRHVLSLPPDDWSGNAALEWVKDLEEGNFFRPCDTYLKTSQTIDMLYEAG